MSNEKQAELERLVKQTETRATALRNQARNLLYLAGVFDAQATAYRTTLVDAATVNHAR